MSELPPEESVGSTEQATGEPVTPKHDIPAGPKKVAAKTAAKSGLKKEASLPKKAAPPPWTFPKNTLEDAIRIARAIEEQNAGNPMRPEMLAKAVGYRSLATDQLPTGVFSIC